ncbi:MAG: hypothetical protein JSS66_11720 [Armatimonadetes bacterium]|nr:hypothetical protein [Armatimonadota bacterium]
MLVESPEWDPEFGIGGFNFLDAIGFRYYLAPAMLRYLKEFPEFDVGLEYVLCHSKLTSDPYRHMQWSLIDDAQAACVRDFLSFMADTCRFLGDEIGSRDWLKALNRYWATRPACSEVSSDRKVKKTWSQRSAIHRKRSATWEPNSDTD